MPWAHNLYGFLEYSKGQVTARSNRISDKSNGEIAFSRSCFNGRCLRPRHHRASLQFRGVFKHEVPGLSSVDTSPRHVCGSCDGDLRRLLLLPILLESGRPAASELDAMQQQLRQCPDLPFLALRRRRMSWWLS
ncbi:uncharacterized protein LOC117650712 [Thrips palmi]|uniref:Uncharacterized protein LOC117650712 n=1 Tax=Thrips palmi TaxID=161013 RepID=A0A6P8ZYI9_THRPL|nr:uncharacterized protein LOC117650712 [Thrips palmi]